MSIPLRTGIANTAKTEDIFQFSPEESIHACITGFGPRHVLLLHGFAASLHTWDDLAPFFPPDEFTLHLLDLKGHGASSKPCRGDYSLLQHARIISSYINSRDLTNVLMVGHSLGGIVSLLVALECRNVSGLILIGAPLFPQKIPRFMRILGLPFIGPLLMVLTPARTIARSGLNAVFYHPERITERHIERYASLYHGLASARSLANTVRQIVPPDLEHLTGRYCEVTTPVLLLWGAHDRIVKPWQGERLLAALRNSRLIFIPDCGHNPHEEQPSQTFAGIRDFLHSCNIDNAPGTC